MIVEQGTLKIFVQKKFDDKENILVWSSTFEKLKSTIKFTQDCLRKNRTSTLYIKISCISILISGNKLCLLSFHKNGVKQNQKTVVDSG